MKEFQETDFYQPPFSATMQGIEQQLKKSSQSNNNAVTSNGLLGRFLKLGKSKSDVHTSNYVKRRQVVTPSSNGGDELEDDFVLAPVQLRGVEKMVHRANTKKDNVSRSHSWIYGSVKLPQDLPFGYGNGYDSVPGSGNNGTSSPTPTPSSTIPGHIDHAKSSHGSHGHDPEEHKDREFFNCSCNDYYNYLTSGNQHHQPLPPPTCQACHPTQLVLPPSHRKYSPSSHPAGQPGINHLIGGYQPQLLGPYLTTNLSGGVSGDSSKKFSNSVRKLTWKSLKQAVKKRPSLDSIIGSTGSKKPEVGTCNYLAPRQSSQLGSQLGSGSQDDFFYSPTNYFFPDKKNNNFYASCTDLFSASTSTSDNSSSGHPGIQHVTASVRLRPKRSRPTWNFPNEFGPVPNYASPEGITEGGMYHSEWDLRQCAMPYEQWLTNNGSSKNQFMDDILMSPVSSIKIQSYSNQQSKKESSKTKSNNSNGNNGNNGKGNNGTNGNPNGNSCVPPNGGSGNGGGVSRGKDDFEDLYTNGGVKRFSILHNEPASAYQLLNGSQDDDRDSDADDGSSEEGSHQLSGDDPVRIAGQGIFMVGGVTQNGQGHGGHGSNSKVTRSNSSSSAKYKNSSSFSNQTKGNHPHHLLLIGSSEADGIWSDTQVEEDETPNRYSNAIFSNPGSSLSPKVDPFDPSVQLFKTFQQPMSMNKVNEQGQGHQSDSQSTLVRSRTPEKGHQGDQFSDRKFQTETSRNDFSKYEESHGLSKQETHGLSSNSFPKPTNGFTNSFPKPTNGFSKVEFSGDSFSKSEHSGASDSFSKNSFSKNGSISTKKGMKSSPKRGGSESDNKYGALRRRRLRATTDSRGGKISNLLRETIYEEESESLDPDDVHSVKILVSQSSGSQSAVSASGSLAGDYVKPILKTRIHTSGTGTPTDTPEGLGYEIYDDTFCSNTRSPRKVQFNNSTEEILISESSCSGSGTGESEESEDDHPVCEDGAEDGAEDGSCERMTIKHDKSDHDYGNDGGDDRDAEDDPETKSCLVRKEQQQIQEIPIKMALPSSLIHHHIKQTLSSRNSSTSSVTSHEETEDQQRFKGRKNVNSQVNDLDEGFISMGKLNQNSSHQAASGNQNRSQHEAASQNRSQHEAASQNRSHHEAASQNRSHHDAASNQNRSHVAMSNQNRSHEAASNQNRSYHELASGTSGNQNRSHEAASQNRSHHEAASQNRSHEAASQNRSHHEAASQNRSHEAASQNRSHEAASQNRSQEAASQNRSHEAASQNRSQEAASQNRSHEAASQNRSHHEAASQNRSHEAVSQNRSPEAASQNRSYEAASKQNRSHEATSNQNRGYHEPTSKQNMSHEAALNKDRRYHEAVSNQNRSPHEAALNQSRTPHEAALNQNRSYHEVASGSVQVGRGSGSGSGSAVKRKESLVEATNSRNGGGFTVDEKMILSKLKRMQQNKEGIVKAERNGSNSELLPGNDKDSEPDKNFNPNSLLFNDTTRIRLNQARPSIENTFQLNDLGVNSKNYGSSQSNGSLANRKIRPSQSFRSNSSTHGGALRPKEPPPPPPRISSAPPPPPPNKAASRTTKSQISLPMPMLGFSTTNNLVAKDSSSSPSSHYQNTVSSAIAGNNNNSKTLLEKCEAVEKMLSQQSTISTGGSAKSLKRCESPGNLQTEVSCSESKSNDSQNIEIVTKENSVSEIRIYSGPKTQKPLPAPKNRNLIQSKRDVYYAANEQRQTKISAQAQSPFDGDSIARADNTSRPQSTSVVLIIDTSSSDLTGNSIITNQNYQPQGPTDQITESTLKPPPFPPSNTSSKNGGRNEVNFNILGQEGRRDLVYDDVIHQQSNHNQLRSVSHKQKQTTTSSSQPPPNTVPAQLPNTDSHHRYLTANRQPLSNGNTRNGSRSETHSSRREANDSRSNNAASRNDPIGSRIDNNAARNDPNGSRSEANAARNDPNGSRDPNAARNDPNGSRDANAARNDPNGSREANAARNDPNGWWVANPTRNDPNGSRSESNSSRCNFNGSRSDAESLHSIYSDVGMTVSINSQDTESIYDDTLSLSSSTLELRQHVGNSAFPNRSESLPTLISHQSSSDESSSDTLVEEEPLYDDILNVASSGSAPNDSDSGTETDVPPPLPTSGPPLHLLPEISLEIPLIPLPILPGAGKSGKGSLSKGTNRFLGEIIEFSKKISGRGAGNPALRSTVLEEGSDLKESGGTKAEFGDTKNMLMSSSPGGGGGGTTEKLNGHGASPPRRPPLFQLEEAPPALVLDNSPDDSLLLDRTRTLLNELNEKLANLNFSPEDYSTYISKVIISSSSDSSGVEEDYNSEKNFSLSDVHGCGNGAGNGGSHEGIFSLGNSCNGSGASSTASAEENYKLSKLVSDTISMARGKFLDSMKIVHGVAGTVAQRPSSANGLGSDDEPIYEEINDSNSVALVPATAGIGHGSGHGGVHSVHGGVHSVHGAVDRNSSPIYADTFDSKSIFDGASRNEILSFLESIRDRLTAGDMNSAGNRQVSLESIKKSRKIVEIERNDSGIGSESGSILALPTQSPLSTLRILAICQDCNDSPVDGRLPGEAGDSPTSPFCRSCYRKRSERKEIVQEIYETELKYGRDLRIISDEFYTPIQTAGLLTKDQLDQIFLNVGQLIEVNVILSSSLKSAITKAIQSSHPDEDLNSVNVGKIFLDIGEKMMSAFESYCTRQASAGALLTQIEKEKELLRIFLRVSQMENAVLRRMNLPAFLMVPVQRVTRYPLLLSRLLKVTAPDHPTREELQLAQEKIEQHLEHMNKTTREVASVKLWRRISIINGNGNGVTNNSTTAPPSSTVNNRRANSDFDAASVRIRKMALDALDWTSPKDVSIVLESQLNMVQCNSAKTTRHIYGILLARGKDLERLSLRMDQEIFFPPKDDVVKDVKLVLVRAKNGRFSLLWEPLCLSKCVISKGDSEFNDFIEINEITTKNTYYLQALDKQGTSLWLKLLQSHAVCVGQWRRRRGALANIMMNGMMRHV